MLPVVVIRPEPGCGATVAVARALGLDARGHPLFAVRPVAWEPPAAGDFDGLLLGSANALRHGGDAIAAWAGKPAWVVGQATADAARASGLIVAATGQGGLQTVLDTLAGSGLRLLRLAARQRIVLEPPRGVRIEERIVYASEPCTMTDEMAGLLASPALVLLHSAEAARHFASECDTRALARSRIALATIGPRVAAAAGEGWARIETAARPDDAALLAIAAQMCK